jgi:hypothetical protein
MTTLATTILVVRTPYVSPRNPTTAITVITDVNAWMASLEMVTRIVKTALAISTTLVMIMHNALLENIGMRNAHAMTDGKEMVIPAVKYLLKIRMHANSKD